MSNGEKYYGGFFWVAVVSFVIPFVVALKAFDKATPVTAPVPAPDASGVDHKVWDYLLKQYLSDGLIDYDGMRKNALFAEYIRQLGAADPDKLETPQEKLALACNAYNALVINGVITRKIKGSVQDLKEKDLDFFELKEHIFAGQTVSLNYIEHSLIRPVFNDPRIHVAIVCAAKSCPAIRPEAFTGERVDLQLQDQSVQFANNPKYVHFDANTGTLYLSKILEWYGSDFDAHYPNGSYLAWIAELAKDPTIKQAATDAISGKVKVAFLKYDWALNSQADSGTVSGDFGSGGGPTE